MTFHFNIYVCILCFKINILLLCRCHVPEEKVYSGPTVLDKSMVGCIWAIAFVYACLTDQVLRDEVEILKELGHLESQKLHNYS